jgi:hypothetical protein
MEIMTNFLAEECLDFLKEKVEPKFPGIRFETYKPGLETTVTKYADRVLIVIDDKQAFKYQLQGISLVQWRIIEGLKKYAFEFHKKELIER